MYFELVTNCPYPRKTKDTLFRTNLLPQVPHASAQNNRTRIDRDFDIGRVNVGVPREHAIDAIEQFGIVGGGLRVDDANRNLVSDLVDSKNNPRVLLRGTTRFKRWHTSRQRNRPFFHRHLDARRVNARVPKKRVDNALLDALCGRGHVRDQAGKEIYRYEERVQDDQIPLYDNMVAVDVLQAVVDQKKEDARLKGIRLADAELIHTSALLDLSYVDRKAARALKLLDDEPTEALGQLLLAQSRGIRLEVNREDDPLVKAQAAIRIAERMAREGKHEAADENLKLARIHLETYRSVLGEAGQDAVQKLQREIQALAGKTGEAGSTEEIRGFWDRVTSWFKSEPGEAHVTAPDSQSDDAHATAADSTKKSGDSK